MPAKNLAKVVWRWGALTRQVADDYRFHKQVRGLPTPFFRRFVEQEKLLWNNRIRASDYYQLGLFDPGLPAEAKRGYIGGFELWRLFFAINPKEYHSLTSKKLEFDAMAAEAGLPVTEVLAVVTNDTGVGGFPTIGSEDELCNWIAEGKIEDVVLKPVDGTKGWGVLSLGPLREDKVSWERMPRGEPIDVAGVWAHCARYLYRGGVIIERRLQPHPVLAGFMPGVLHTVRAVSYLAPEPTIVSAALRVGSGKGPADNLAQGGIVVPIDVASGRCGRGTMLVDGLPQFVDEHPVSGTRMTDVILPDWQQAHDLVKAAAETFKVQKSIGWDIGLTTRGPVLLEGNWRYDLGVNQIAHRKGILDTPWVEVFNREGAYQHLGLGFVNRPRV